MRKLIQKIIISILCVVAVTGCTTTEIDTSHSPGIVKDAKYGVIPFRNQTATPMVGMQATTITTALLHSVGISSFTEYNPVDDAKKAELQQDLFASNEYTRSNLINWALSQNITYLLMGDVNEWRYKVGLDGEPAVGVTLYVVYVPLDKVVWSAVGSRRGSTNHALSGVGQTLILRLLNDIDFT